MARALRRAPPLLTQPGESALQVADFALEVGRRVNNRGICPLPLSAPSIKDRASSRQVRHMRREDIPAVAELFFAAFRPGRRASESDFAPYFERLFFDGPAGEGGGFVAPGEDGGLDGAGALLPMRFRLGGRVVKARLACAFMARPNATMAAARITMATRASRQDLIFSDSASPVSARHMAAIGGRVLPVESLDWICRFRPLRALAARVGLPPPAGAVLGLLDRELVPADAGRDEGVTLSPLCRDDYVALAPDMIRHFTVRPEWSSEEMTWLLERAAESTTLGKLRFFGFFDRAATPLGCMAAYRDHHRRVYVLDLLPAAGHEAAVAAAMHRHFLRSGVVEARGLARAHHLAALSPLRGMRFRHRAFMCLGSRHPELSDAVERGDVYIGGLAGETWSRLMHDFH